MERIVIEVDDTTAEKWRYITPEAKQKLSKKINQLLKTSLAKSNDDFWEFVEAVRKTAQENGLTEDELNKILNEE